MFACNSLEAIITVKSPKNQIYVENFIRRLKTTLIILTIMLY